MSYRTSDAGAAAGLIVATGLAACLAFIVGYIARRVQLVRR